MTEQTTVIELPERSGFEAQIMPEINRGLMVQWINADLTARATYDVRTSLALYDADGDFVSALPASIAELDNFDDIRQKLFDETTVRFYSKGVR